MIPFSDLVLAWCFFFFVTLIVDMQILRFFLASLCLDSGFRYSTSTIVTTARKALVKQARAMLLSVWQESHHVCENYSTNYSPHLQVRDGPKCTGDPFYTWGGLNTLMSLLEAENAPGSIGGAVAVEVSRLAQ